MLVLDCELIEVMDHVFFHLPMVFKMVPATYHYIC